MNEQYAYYLYSPRPDYGVTPTFYHRNDLPSTGFASLYAVTRETAQAITKAGTTKGFKGIVWAERLWLDIDSYESADTVEERLRSKGYDYISCDTGGRGAHFGILRNNNPSHLLPQQDKVFVEEHFPEADSSIYTHLHPFRLLGTPHERTGKQKLRVGQAGTSALVLNLYQRKEKAHKQFSFEKTHKNERSIFDDFFIQRNSQQVKEGERHAQLVRLTYALRDSGYDINLARWWVNEVNKRFQPPKSADEVEKIIGSIYV